MRHPQPLIWLVLLCALAPAYAQTPHPTFLQRPHDGHSVSGIVNLVVSADPLVRPREVRYGFSVDDRILEQHDTLPWTLSWNSASVPDGPHILRLLRIDTRTRSLKVLDEFTAQVANRERQRTPPSEKTPSPTPPLPGRTPSTVKPDRPSPPAPPKPDEIGPQKPDVVDRRAAPERRIIPQGPVNDPLSIPATSLLSASGKLYLGHPDGGVTIYDPASRRETTLRAPESAGRTRALAVSQGWIWWLAEPAGSAPKERASFSLRWLFGCHTATGRIRAFDLEKIGCKNALPRIAAWHDRVYLFDGPASLCILDPKTGGWVETTGALPPDAFGPGVERLEMTADDSGAVLAILRRVATRSDDTRAWEVAAWRGRGGAWIPAGSRAVTSSGGQSPGLCLAPRRLVVVEAAAISELPLTGEDRRGMSLSSGAQAPIGAHGEVMAVAGGNSVWWTRGGRLFHADLEKGALEAFLPWNIKMAGLSALAVDAGGAWVGNGKEVVRVSLQKGPDGERGYGGFVRVPLGEDTTQPRDAAQERLASLIQEWQGVPYKWGGSSKMGTDCSGFIMSVFNELGVPLPHGSMYLASAPGGVTVRDELRFGDVLVYPGHCAIYTGDGSTAETVRGKVGTATIWNRSDVVVRRFLGVTTAPIRSELSSRSGRRQRGPVRRGKRG